jgi:hypothetical protein
MSLRPPETGARGSRRRCVADAGPRPRAAEQRATLVRPAMEKGVVSREIGTRERRMTTGYEGRVILVTGATVFGLARRSEALEAARARHPQIHWRRGDVTDAIKACTAVENAVGTKKECRSIDKREMTASRGRLTRRRSSSMKEVKIVATA